MVTKPTIAVRRSQSSRSRIAIVSIISIPNPSSAAPPSSLPPSSTSDYNDTYEDDVHVVAHSTSKVEQASNAHNFGSQVHR
uniref:Uncharacterized protein n=1 Tax=Nelumbo nucifera TaxID=4432 RepID=A0A822YBI8_NELNU|nr:TPA_asm: hypothetical protein HUJ06_031265 [Nelumbo nucifera]